jgi:hypothetical protein
MIRDAMRVRGQQEKKSEGDRFSETALEVRTIKRLVFI